MRMPTIQKTIKMYNFIRGYIASNGEAPTFDELCRQFNYKSTASVFDHLEKMEKRGWITRIPNISRGIRLVDQDKRAA